MPHTRDKGFILFIAVAVIPLIGIAMLLLASGAKTMVVETAMMTEQANERNLTASAIAWVRANQHELVAQREGFTKQLDITAFDLKHVRCTVTLLKITKDEAHVMIEAAHSRDGRPMRHNLKLAISQEGKNQAKATGTDGRVDEKVDKPEP
ncbi:MAG: hypothetical protein J7M40_17195 [Planctomycetes bacterium]|nr:hypothetical protein [Planctomycetota bacterium]